MLSRTLRPSGRISATDYSPLLGARVRTHGGTELTRITVVPWALRSGIVRFCDVARFVCLRCCDHDICLRYMTSVGRRRGRSVVKVPSPANEGGVRACVWGPIRKG